MRNGTYTARRRADVKEWRGNATREFGMGENFGAFSTGFSRNRNTIKFMWIKVQKQQTLTINCRGFRHRLMILRQKRATWRSREQG